MNFIHKRKESQEQTKPGDDLEVDVRPALLALDFHIQSTARLGDCRFVRNDSTPSVEGRSGCTLSSSRVEQSVAYQPHKLEVAGSSPAPAPTPWFKFWPVLVVVGGIVFYAALFIILTTEILVT